MTEIRRLSLAELELERPDELFVLLCAGYNGQFWNEPSGYGIDPCEAKLWTRDEAIRQIKQGHERREIAINARAYVDSFRRFIARVEGRRASLNARRIVRGRLESRRKCWTIALSIALHEAGFETVMVSGWLLQSLQREPSADEVAAGQAEFRAYLDALAAAAKQGHQGRDE